jgi:hypothetical protein
MQKPRNIVKPAQKHQSKQQIPPVLCHTLNVAKTKNTLYPPQDGKGMIPSHRSD